MNIEIQKASGAYWEQSMSHLLEYAVEKNFDYALAIDHDSVFRPEDVFYLSGLMAANPEAAAIFPLQYRRGVDQILFARADGSYESPVNGDFSNHLVESKMGHFGLTLIRTSVLKNLPHPWLMSQPNSEGKWTDGKVDADVYFWRKLTKHGFKTYCAPRCVLGHMQLMVTFPGKDLKPIHNYVQQYFKDGDLPEDVKEAALERTRSAVAISSGV